MSRTSTNHTASPQSSNTHVEVSPTVRDAETLIRSRNECKATTPTSKQTERFSFDRITAAVENIMECTEKYSTVTRRQIHKILTDAGYNHDEIEMAVNVAELVQDAKSYWKRKGQKTYSQSQRRGSVDSLAELHPDLNYAAAMTDVHLDWVVEKTIERGLNADADVDTTNYSGSKNDLIRYTFKKQLDDVPLQLGVSKRRHYSFSSSSVSDTDSDSWDEDPNSSSGSLFDDAGELEEFSRTLYSLPTPRQQLGSVCRSYIALMTQPEEKQIEGLVSPSPAPIDTSNNNLWLQLLCSEFSGFNRDFIKRLFWLHKYDLEKTVFALNELDISRRMQEFGSKNKRRNSIQTFVPQGLRRKSMSRGTDGSESFRSSSTWDDDEDGMSRVTSAQSVASTISRLSFE